MCLKVTVSSQAASRAVPREHNAPKFKVCPKENSWAHLHCRCTSRTFCSRACGRGGGLPRDPKFGSRTQNDEVQKFLSGGEIQISDPESKSTMQAENGDQETLEARPKISRLSGLYMLSSPWTDRST